MIDDDADAGIPGDTQDDQTEVHGDQPDVLASAEHDQPHEGAAPDTIVVGDKDDHLNYIDAMHREANEAREAIVDATEDQGKPSLDGESQGPIKLLNEIYSDLRRREQRGPLPEDVIKAGYVKPGSVEYQTLLDSGLTPAQLEQRTFTRKELLDAGYKFVNILGNGEKGVINGVVTDPETGETADFTGRTFLTQAELEMVYRFQQSQPEVYGLQGEDLDEVRKDMTSFALEAVAEPAFQDNMDFRDQLMYDDKVGYGPSVGDAEDWKAVKAFWDRREKAYRKNHKEAKGFAPLWAVQEEFAREHCQDLYTWTDKENTGFMDAFRTKQIRGHAVSSTPSRIGKLTGQPSPFLESGFVFADNFDANVFLDGKPDQRSDNQLRINSATIHLAGAHPDFPGFSEMGGQTDQQYMPTGYYVNHLYTRDPAERQKVHESERTAAMSVQRQEIIIQAQERLINFANNEMGSAKRNRWHHRVRNRIAK